MRRCWYRITGPQATIEFSKMLQNKDYEAAGKLMGTLMQQVATDANITNPYNIKDQNDPTGPLSDALDKYLARSDERAVLCVCLLYCVYVFARVWMYLSSTVLMILFVCM